MELLLIGFAVSFNILIIIWKISHNRLFDGLLDGTILFGITYTFSGTYSALVVGTIASFIVSLYLLINQPKLGVVDDS